MIQRVFCELQLIFIPCKNNRYKPKFLGSKFLFYYAVVLLLLKLLIIPFLCYFPKTAFFADLTQVSLIQFTNLTRQQLGYPALEENEILNQAARLKAKDMIEKGYFDHYSPEGTSPWYWLEESGYNYAFAGENLAIGFLESEQVHRAWMNSFSHKKNIINPNYQEIGIAVVKGDFQGNETALVVQFLGTQRTIIPQEKPIDSLVSQIEEKEKREETAGRVISEEIRDETEGKKAREEMEGGISEGTEKETEGEIVEKTILGKKELEKTPALLLFQFMMSDYYNWLQRIIYGSLILIIIFLFVAVYCDVFIYRKFKIDHKDIVFKAIGFSTLWFALICLDKLIIVQIVAQNFRIS